MVSLMTRAFFRLSGQHHNISLRYLSSQTIAPLKYDNVEIQYTTTPKAKPDPSTLVFGKTFSDHMLSVPWNNVTGWQTPKIHPLKPFQMHPAAKVYHYANELFEGMKAYRGKDNVIRLFRPTENMIRMNNSAKRATLPMFDGDELIKLITKLVHIDQEWTPYSTTASLYIRPTIIATEPSLGVTPPNESLLYVLLCPVGAYYPTGMKPVSLLADSRYVRAWPGGSGNTKMGANYAPTTYIQKIAEKEGCQQVLWLYGEDHMLTEVGTMNIFVLWTNEQGEKELITPPLDMGVILPGVTRSSILALAQNWGEFKVSEKIITMKDLMKALDEGRVKEMFGAGTACIVSPVERILYEGKNIHIPTMENKAEIALRFMKELLDIQYGRNSPHEWAVVVNDPSS